MLQLNLQPYASDCVEDAMSMADIKAFNSFKYSDILMFMNYTWADVYNKICLIDDGYYSLTKKVPRSGKIHLPPFVKNTVKVYRAKSPESFEKIKYIQSGINDLGASRTFAISGFDFICPDAARGCDIWINFTPQPQQITFTNYNRDPIIRTSQPAVEQNKLYNIYELHIGNINSNNVITEIAFPLTNDLESVTFNYAWLSDRRNPITVTPLTPQVIAANNGILLDEVLFNHNDVTDTLTSRKWKIVYLSCDYPYIFVTYKHTITGEYNSGFFDKDWNYNEYNAFAFSGRNTNVKYMQCHWNDKTGMGVIIHDYNDTANPYKELGWTPDTLLIYPDPSIYRLMTAKLASTFAMLNQSTIPVVQDALASAEFAVDTFLAKDKSSWSRIDNVRGPFISDLL